MRHIAPEVADQITLLYANKLNFLAEKAPKLGEAYSKVQPYLYYDAYLNPDSTAKFERYLLATIDPIGSILSEVSTGTLSGETMETIARIYPSMLDDIRMKTMEVMADDDKPVSASKMAEIAKVFDQSMVKYQNPGFIQRQQTMYKQKVKQGSLGGLKKSSARVGVMQEMAQTGPQSVTSNLRKG